jgi:predicted AAA+ superfamily ATPase
VNHPAVLLDPGDEVVADVAAEDGAARARVVRALAWAAVTGPPAVANPLADLLLDRVLDHEGPFAAAAERAGSTAIPAVLTSAAQADLRLLQRLSQSSPQHEAAGPGALGDARAALKQAVTGRADWGEAAADLAAFFARLGAGALNRYRVFRWDSGLHPVPEPDPITLADLVGYESQRGLLAANLEAFVRGRSANNALLYGDRGSGKSATVKALAAAHRLEDLRLVEVARERLADFPALATALRHRPARFLLLVDDLAFEEGEVSYAGLKSLLQGGVEAQPPNVLLYATSNRRHLVREDFADRAAGPNTGAGEIHVSDSFQEKLSLSDRFGLRVLFLAPDEKGYLEVARHIARRRGLPVDGEFDAAARRWCLTHNARSCRTARQFVDARAGS